MGQRDDELTRRWVETWRRAGPALEAIQLRELRELSDEQRALQIDDLLRIACQFATPRLTSGLVEQQRLFQKLRPRARREDR